MKTKDLKKMLKESYNNSSCEITENEELKENILKNVHHEINPNSVAKIVKYESAKGRITKKKWFYPILSSGIAVAFALVFVFTYVFGSLPIKKEGVKQIGLTFSREVMALGNVVSSVSGDIIENNIPLSLASNVKKVNEDSQEFSQEEYEKCQKVAEEVNRYILTADAFLKEKNIKVVFESNKDPKYKNYKYFSTVSFKDAKGFEICYIVYYNLKEDKDKIFIDGILVSDQKEYPLKGESITKKRETKCELTVKTGKNTSVKVENESEFNENEYNYTYYQNDKVVKEVSMELSSKGDVDKTEIEIFENGKRVCYEFTYEKQTIECEYKTNGVTIEIIVFVHDDYYLYVFEDKYAVKKDKN